MLLANSLPVALTRPTPIGQDFATLLSLSLLIKEPRFAESVFPMNDSVPVPGEAFVVNNSRTLGRRSEDRCSLQLL